jgi:hypothetical protein
LNVATDIPTPEGLRNFLVEILAGAGGGEAGEWRAAIGEVEKLCIATNVRSNWAVHPKGSPQQLATIGHAVMIVRRAHPYVAG